MLQSFPWEYSTDPAMDGVVIDWNTLPGASTDPNFASYNQGKTGVHEVGHW